MRLVPLAAFLFLAAAAPLAAWARAAVRVVPGQKLFGELDPNQSVTVLVDAVQGTKFGVKCKAFRGTTLRVDVALADPDGTPVDLSALKRTNSKASLVSFAGLVLARTGSYRLTVSSLNATTGGFDLATTGVAAKKLSGTGTVTSAGLVADVPFAALPGDVVTCTVKPAKGSALRPLLHRFADAGGAEQVFDLPKQPSPVTVATTGTSRFEVTGSDGTSGAFVWSLKLARVRAPKDARDAAELAATGRVSGVIVLDGEASRTSAGRAAKSAPSPRGRDVRAGEVVASVPGARDAAEAEAAVGASMPGLSCRVVAALSDRGPYLVRIEHLAARGSGARAKSATRALAKSAAAAGHLRWCEPNGVVAKCVEPNDALYPQQFNLRYVGLPKVWNVTEGNPTIGISVIDTGYVAHPDLYQNLVAGYDFVSDSADAADGDGWDASPVDTAYDLHGTHVAGIVGARSNNKSGISGAVWQAKIQPVRVLGANGGSFFDVAAGLRWAAGLAVPNAPLNTNPARVVNMSLGAAYDDTLMREAVEEVQAQTNVVIVAAAGNEGSSQRFYPAAYPGVIPVHALDANLLWASYSNWGDWISIGVPGGDPYRGQAGILSTFFDVSTGKPSYAELSGTSMASPLVAGIAVLLISAKPTLTRTEVRDVLERTSLDLGPPGFDVDFGFGMADAAAALDYVLTPFAPPNAIDVAPGSLAFEGVANQSFVFVRTKSQTPVAISQIDVTTNVSSGWLTVTPDRMTTPATLTVTVDPLLDPGTYTGRIRLTTSAGVVDVPVRVVRAPRPKLTFVLVSAVDERGNVVARATTSAAKGWAYDLEDLPLGRYRISALADQNSNILLDRVDEWEGLWPLRTQPDFVAVTPESLDAAAVDVPLERYDARFTFRGVGAGHVAGAVAILATDAETGRPVASASVHLAGGLAQTVTDARGRAVVVGSFSGAQPITVVAEGYGPMTRVGQDAQFQAFPLEPLVAKARVDVLPTIRGLGPADAEVLVQVGDGRARAAYDGATDPSVALTYADTGAAIPVSVVALDAAGVPTRTALLDLDAPSGPIDVQVAALHASGSQARYVQPSVGTGPFNSSGAAATATTWLRWESESWVAVGESPLALGQSRPGWYGDPGAFTPSLPMKFEVRAADTAGRVLVRNFYGSTDTLDPSPAAFTFDAAAALVAPAASAQGVALAPLMSFTSAPGAGLHRIVVERTGTPWRWTIWAGGTTTQVQVPAIGAGGLAAATAYRWSVETWRFAAGGFDAASYREQRIDTDPTSRAFSGWSAFTTQ